MTPLFVYWLTEQRGEPHLSAAALEELVGARPVPENPGGKPLREGPGRIVQQIFPPNPSLEFTSFFLFYRGSHCRYTRMYSWAVWSQL